MRRAKRFGRAAAAIVLSAIALCATAAVAGAESSAEEEELNSWLPNLALSFDVHTQSFDVSGASFWAGVDGGDDVNFIAEQTENVLTSVFSVDGSISTPALSAGFGSPRLFVQAGIQAPLSDEFSALNSTKSFLPLGGETESFCPDIDGPMDPPPRKQSCDQSLKSTLTMNFNWSAGIGAEFTLPTPSRAFKIRAAVEYFGQSFDFDGEARRADRIGGASPGSNGAVIETFFIDAGSASKTYHSIGPRLTVSGEVGRAGPLSFGIFVETRLYWLLNNGDVELTGAIPEGNVSILVEPDSLVAQGGAGLRITWVGSR